MVAYVPINTILKFLYKEPLLHFLLISALLFFLYNINKSQNNNLDTDNIVVSEVELVKYIQYRKRAFKPQASGSELEKLDKYELQNLIDNYIREQVLYREAISLGLDQEDYIIKQRLIQKIEFLLKGFVETELTVTQDDVEKHYRLHQQKYTIPARISFSHIYFNNQDRTQIETLEHVTIVLQQLRDNQLFPAQVRDRGDRFIYFKNYADKSHAFVASHFGEAFSDKVFQLKETDIWSGPLRSDHGEHIVWVNKKQSERLSSLEEVYDRVEDNVRVELVDAAVEKKIQEIIQKYTIVQSYSARIIQQGR